MKIVFLDAAELEIVKARVLQDMRRGGRTMIMMPYAAGDDHNYY